MATAVSYVYNATETCGNLQSAESIRTLNFYTPFPQQGLTLKCYSRQLSPWFIIVSLSSFLCFLIVTFPSLIKGAMFCCVFTAVLPCVSPTVPTNCFGPVQSFVYFESVIACLLVVLIREYRDLS